MDKSENLDNGFLLFFTFLTWHFKKT